MTSSGALLITTTILLALPSAAATEPAGLQGEMSLAEAVELALERNSDLLAARAHADAEDAAWDAARAGRLPSVGVELASSRTTNPVMVFSQLLGQESFTAANFDPARLNEPDALTNSMTRITARQAVWSGGGLGAEIRAARSSRDAADAQYERARQRVVHAVADAYAEAVHAAARLGVAREARETARQHARMAEDLHANGLAVLSDVLQARVREREVDALVVTAESGVEVARAGLNLVIGVELDRPLRLPRSLDAALDAVRAGDPGDVAELIAVARRERPDLAAAAHATDAARSGIARARSARRPRIGLSASYEANADGWPGADGSSWTMMLGAQLPLVEGGAIRARTRRAEAAHRHAAAMQENAQRAIELEVRQSAARLRAANARARLTGAAIEMAEESLRIVRDRYQEGLTTLAELLDAETALTRARTNDVTARRDLLTARYALDLAVGTL